MRSVTLAHNIWKANRSRPTRSSGHRRSRSTFNHSVRLMSFPNSVGQGRADQLRQQFGVSARFADLRPGHDEHVIRPEHPVREGAVVDEGPLPGKVEKVNFSAI